MDRLQEVYVPALPPQRLRGVLGPARLGEFLAEAAATLPVLDQRAVLNVNSTATGGGVAEMLHTLLAYTRGIGIDTRWFVVSAESDFFAVTKRLHNHIYGFSGDGGPLGEEEHKIYARTLAPNLTEMLAIVRPGDVVLLHDPQTAGLTSALKDAGAQVVWRCHIGSDERNEFSDIGWSFLQRYVERADGFVFSRTSFAPEWMPRYKVVPIRPSLDPFSPKNQEMDPDIVRSALVHAGLLAGKTGPEPVPVFRRRDGSPLRVDRHADVLQSGQAPDPDAPLVVQVSRWDAMKDMPGVMKGFADGVALETDAHLMLAGPSVAGVADDPEGAEVLDACTRQWRALPHAIRSRVHLACLPMRDMEENAAIVNALQRHAAIVTQKSLAEGFGLTVVEAMWKRRPVIGTAIGGIADQIVDGESGLLVQDPNDLEEFAGAVLRVLKDPLLSARLGKGAFERAHERFLADRHLETWAHLIRGDLLSERAETGQSVVA